MIIMIMMIIINLIYIAQFDTDGIVTALYSHEVHTNAIYANMDIHETIIFIHIYMSTHMDIHRHEYKFAVALLNLRGKGKTFTLTVLKWVSMTQDTAKIP